MKNNYPDQLEFDFDAPKKRKPGEEPKVVSLKQYREQRRQYQIGHIVKLRRQRKA